MQYLPIKSDTFVVPQYALILGEKGDSRCFTLLTADVLHSCSVLSSAFFACDVDNTVVHEGRTYRAVDISQLGLQPQLVVDVCSVLAGGGLDQLMVSSTRADCSARVVQLELVLALYCRTFTAGASPR